jgi:hypothetical protein
MPDDAAILARSLDHLARETRTRWEAGSHPEPELLAAYHGGELAAAEDREIQDHLVLCPDCPQLLLDLEDLFEPRRRDLGLSDTGVGAAWEDLQSRLGDAGSGRARGFHRGEATYATPRWSQVLAACLLVLVVALSFRARSLLRDLHLRDQPRANPIVVDLSSSNSRGAGPSRTEVPAGAGDLVLILHPDEAPSFPDYRAEVLATTDGHALWAVRGLARSAEGTFSLVVPRRSLPPGAYLLRLSGIDESGRARSLGEFGLRLAGR